MNKYQGFFYEVDFIMAKKLILASASPRRREILETAGYSYTAVPSNAEELTEGLDSLSLVRENSLRKAREVFARTDGDAVVLGSDTVVCIGDEILGKPKDFDDAAAMLKRQRRKTNGKVLST